MKAQKPILFVSCINIFLITCCFTQSKKNWGEEKKKVMECREKWLYSDLQQEQRVEALLFSPKYSQDVSSFPNFLIGVTANKDTIAFLDKDYESKIEKGDTLKVVPMNWSNDDKNILKPLFIVYKNSSQNDLLCKIKTVYYCKIVKE